MPRCSSQSRRSRAEHRRPLQPPLQPRRRAQKQYPASRTHGVVGRPGETRPDRPDPRTPAPPRGTTAASDRRRAAGVVPTAARGGRIAFVRRGVDGETLSVSGSSQIRARYDDTQRDHFPQHRLITCATLHTRTVVRPRASPSECGKKDPPRSGPRRAEREGGTRRRTRRQSATNTSRTSRVSRQETRRTSIEELSWLAEDDPAVLRRSSNCCEDKGTAARARRSRNQINSTREAAALAIMACTKGEAMMKEKGLPHAARRADRPVAR